MNFLSNLAKTAGGQSTDESKKPAGDESGSTTELFASAKVLAEAAQSQFNKDSSAAPVDNKKVAEAAADVLDAAQKYGKLDETQGIGQYVEKAETYLHQYGSDTSAAPPVVAATDEKSPTPVPEQETKAPAPEAEPAPTPVEEPEPAPVKEEEEKKSEGGADYLKMAGDFLSKK